MPRKLPFHMKPTPISCYDHVTLRPLNILGAIHDPDFIIQIVPAHEADAAHGRISAEAPIGRAVLHRHCGDEVTVRVQDHTATLCILSVETHRYSESVHTSLSALPARQAE